MENENNHIDQEIIDEQNEEQEEIFKTQIGSNTTHIKRTTYEQLYKTITEKNVRTFYVFLVFAIIGGLLIIFLGEKNSRFLGFASIGLGAVFFPLMLLLSKKTVAKSIDKHLEANQNSFFEYTFYEDCVHLKVHAQNEIVESESDYASFYKIVETDLFIFVFVNTRAVFAIDKAGFNEGEYDIVATQLKIYVPKYAIKNK